MRRFLSIIFVLMNCAAFAQPTSFTSRGIGGGGALFSPSINPAKHQELYFSCDMSELFHSTDFGTSYSQVPFQEFNGGHDSKVNFTSTAGLLFSISYIDDVGTPVKSTDNGTTWTPLAGNPNENNYKLTVDYANPDRILMATYDQLYFSSNRGTTFTSIKTATSSELGIVVAGTFFDGSNIYVGTNEGLLISSTGGASWSTSSVTGIPAGQSIWSFAGAKQGGVTRLFCITGNTGSIYAGMPGSDYWDFFKGLYSCDYGSGNWVSKTNGITAGTDFPMFIDMAENDINTVYIAGSNSDSEPIVMKSTNAGTAWGHTFITAMNDNIKTGWSGRNGDRGWSYGECPFGFEVASNNSALVVFTDFGFCHKTADGGTSWEQAYVNKADKNPANANTPKTKSYASIGLENTTCWQVHWTDVNNLWSCYSDIRGLRSVDAGKKWSYNYSGTTANSTYRVVQTADGKLFAATSGIHDMYQSTRLQDTPLDGSDGSGKIIYSTDKGLTWQELHLFNHPVFWIALDPSNPNRAYASVIHYNNGSGIGGVYRCDNLNLLSGSTWTLLADPPRTQKHPASLTVLNDGKLVASFSGRRTSAGFTASSGVFLFNPTSNSWTDVSHSGMQYWTKDVIIDPTDITQNTWLAGVFSGWGGPPNGLGGLYKTTNRGASWTKLTGNLLDRVTSCTFNPANQDEVYVTTETQGLWVSKDIHAANPVFTQVANYPFRQPERVFFNPFDTNEMWVSSFGNGMKMGLMNAPPLPVTLTDFRAAEAEGKILISWETTDQIAFDHFILERSVNAKNGFIFLSKTLASRGSAGNYVYEDSTVTTGINYYYRLKMFDTDGSWQSGKIITTRLQDDNKVLVFPNPSSRNINIRSANAVTSVILTNSSGQVVVKQLFTPNNHQTLNLPRLSAGAYLLMVISKDGEKEVHKVLIE